MDSVQKKKTNIATNEAQINFLCLNQSQKREKEGNRGHMQQTTLLLWPTEGTAGCVFSSSIGHLCFGRIKGHAN